MTTESLSGLATLLLLNRSVPNALRISDAASVGSSGILEDHTGHGKIPVVGDGKRGAPGPQPSGHFRCPAMEAKRGPSAGFAHHFDLQPGYTAAYACSQRLGACFLGGKPGRQAFGRLAFAQAIGLLGGRVYT